jgi:AcrR family transcriptional regulator
MEGSVVTPWGRSDQLRERRLRPGPGKQRADVERNHRARLHGAMVAIVDEEGYEGMSVAAVAARAGVSRGALYEYFDGGQACFLATFEALMEEGLARVSRAYAASEGPWDIRLGKTLDSLFEALVTQPAAARLCFLEIHTAGAASAELRERGTSALEALVSDAFDQSPKRAGMPQEVVCALVGGIRTVIQARLRRRDERELLELSPHLLRWLISYPRPGLARAATPPTTRPTPPFVASSHRDRLFVALAQVVYEKGYRDATVSDVVTAAGISLSTFYENFEGKQEAFLAACDFGIEQAFAAVHHAWESERANGWPAQVEAGMRKLLDLLAAEPEWSYMATVEILAAGSRACARCDRTIALFTGLVEPGRKLAPHVGPVAIEAIGGAVYSLINAQIRKHGAERLPEILAVCVFVLLAPFAQPGAGGKATYFDVN